ncbi:MAG TPA: recombination protein O N-terminal domain-containing protein [Acidocella sp.]|nr:recombination protein O N-terminal domain-containing protein [Acidocella sp.]
MEWQEPAIVLETTAYGEGDLLVSVLTAQGLWRGLVKGGASRGKTATWQKGNFVAARWAARLAEQLGGLSGELVHPTAALALPEAQALAVLEAACALAVGALPEREVYLESFTGLMRLFAGIHIPGYPLTELVRWEVVLLRELGFGLDFPADNGGNDRLAYVSPRTGRAVTLSQAGEWAERLLPLPEFMAGEAEASLGDCLAGLRITGHFFARDVFGGRNRPLPTARARLYDQLSDRLAQDKKHAR